MAYRIWTPEEEILLKNLVSTGLYSYRDMEKFFPGRTLSSLTKHARIYLNIHNDIYKQHKYTYTKGFFATPNILNSYVAGFWAADGSIRDIPNASPRLRLELGEEDLEYLKNMKKILGYTGVIAPFHKGNSTTHWFSITIDEEYKRNLADNFGIVQRKTHHLTPPNLTTFDLRFAFLVGLLDGDGCTHINSRNESLSLGYTSSSIAAVEWVKRVTEECNLPTLRKKPSGIIRKVTNVNAYSIVLNGAKVVAFIKLVQAFAAHYNLPILRRKWDTPRLNEYIKSFEIRYPKFSYTPPSFPLDPVPIETTPSIAA